MKILIAHTRKLSPDLEQLIESIVVSAYWHNCEIFVIGRDTIVTKKADSLNMIYQVFGSIPLAFEEVDCIYYVQGDTRHSEILGVEFAHLKALAKAKNKTLIIRDELNIRQQI